MGQSIGPNRVAIHMWSLGGTLDTTIDGPYKAACNGCCGGRGGVVVVGGDNDVPRDEGTVACDGRGAGGGAENGGRGGRSEVNILDCY